MQKRQVVLVDTCIYLEILHNTYPSITSITGRETLYVPHFVLNALEDGLLASKSFSGTVPRAGIAGSVGRIK